MDFALCGEAIKTNVSLALTFEEINSDCPYRGRLEKSSRERRRQKDGPPLSLSRFARLGWMEARVFDISDEFFYPPKRDK